MNCRAGRQFRDRRFALLQGGVPLHLDCCDFLAMRVGGGGQPGIRVQFPLEQGHAIHAQRLPGMVEFCGQGVAFRDQDEAFLAEKIRLVFLGLAQAR